MNDLMSLIVHDDTIISLVLIGSGEVGIEPLSTGWDTCNSTFELSPQILLDIKQFFHFVFVFYSHEYLICFCWRKLVDIILA